MNPYLSPEAYPVYGIRADFDGKGGGKPVSAVYAIPQNYDSSPSQPLKGTVLLLHACTHNALKFFAPSSLCKDCVGLAEEMRLARMVLERGYAAVAVTASSEGGCWGGDEDVKAIQTALENFSRHYKNSHNLDLKIEPTVHALGASSGGAMAAKLVAEGVAESGAVMVMSLRNPLLDKILSLKERKKLYLAPMIRDQGTTKRVRENEAYWKSKQQQQQQQQHKLIVDEISCIPLPVTVDYLWNRVPRMTKEAANIIVTVLLDHKHLDPNTMKLIVDPTRSKWRDFFLNNDKLPVPASLKLSQSNKIIHDPNNNNNNMMLWDTFDLTPGISPLAKALHRAWAMHEYCSEIVELALDFFEGQKTRSEILDILQHKKLEQEPTK